MIRPLLGTDTTKLGGWLVTEKGMQALKASLPACEIVFDRDSALPVRRSK